jgi:hypothetical protein
MEKIIKKFEEAERAAEEAKREKEAAWTCENLYNSFVASKF